MAAEYTPDANLLSDKAASSPQLDAQTELAIDLLNLRGTGYVGEDKNRAERALALQVNLQVENGVEASAYTSLKRGERSFTFRGTSVDTTAAQLVASLTTTNAGGGEWTNVTSVRH
jgi:hypothetical protein